MDADPNDIELSPKRAAVFQLILSSGKKGVTEEDIDARLFRGKGKSTVRSAIHYINKRIYPMRIEGRYGYGYRVVREN